MGRVTEEKVRLLAENPTGILPDLRSFGVAEPPHPPLQTVSEWSNRGVETGPLGAARGYMPGLRDGKPTEGAQTGPLPTM
jgi:hypothetical protein